MSDSPTQVAAGGNRLVRLLRELGPANTAPPPQAFALRLGQFIDLSDSIDLATTHLQLHQLPFERSSRSAESVRTDFLEVRAAMLGAIARSFSPGGNPGKLRLPEIALDKGEETDLRPYLRFYSAMQRDMEFRVRNLQDRVRIALRGISLRLARLVELEEALDQTLIHQHRESFAALPQLLEHRFTQHRGSAEGGALLTRCRRDMQSLLLAEIDARLLPVLGLIEDLDEEPENEPSTN